MNSKTKILLLRHGQSIGNVTKTFLGHTDLDLSELGYKQAKAVEKCLENEKIDQIYSSDLIRAYNTAKFTADFHKITIKTSKNLREVYAGKWDNKTVDQLIDGWGIKMFTEEWKGNFGEFVFPAGESIKEAEFRFYNEIKTISEQNIGKTIVICSHAAVIRAFWSMISGIEWKDISARVPFATNASLSIVEYENGKFTPIRYSIDEHLSEVGITKVNLI